MIFIVMGVAGCGKTTIGKLLASELRLPFYDGDDFHPRCNIEKMARAVPLTDDDRRPWLERLAREMAQWENTGGAVLVCSALRKAYRDLLRSGASEVRFIHLKGSKEVIAERMRARMGHFMPQELLDSQFATLEEPRDAIEADISLPPEEVVSQIVRAISEEN